MKEQASCLLRKPANHNSTATNPRLRAACDWSAYQFPGETCDQWTTVRHTWDNQTKDHDGGGRHGRLSRRDTTDDAQTPMASPAAALCCRSRYRQLGTAAVLRDPLILSGTIGTLPPANSHRGNGWRGCDGWRMAAETTIDGSHKQRSRGINHCRARDLSRQVFECDCAGTDPPQQSRRDTRHASQNMSMFVNEEGHVNFIGSRWRRLRV
jgi:hypothetical protein